MTTVVIDHDGTYSTDPVAWTKVIEVLQAAGFGVVCISSRFPDCPLPPMPVPVLYACGESKWSFAHRHGIDAAIWIDDCPSQIGENPDPAKRAGWPQRELREQVANAAIDQIRAQMMNSEVVQ